MSVRFLVFFSLSLVLGLSSCTKSFKYDSSGMAVNADVKVMVSGDGQLDQIYWGKYTITVKSPSLFMKTVFASSKCSEYNMLITKDSYALYKDSYRLSMACTATVNPYDYFPFMPWEDNVRHGVVYKKTYIEKSSLQNWYDIGTDFIFHNYQSVGSVGGTNYVAKTLINFTPGEVTITLYERDVSGKETRAVVATGYKTSSASY